MDKKKAVVSQQTTIKDISSHCSEFSFIFGFILILVGSIFFLSLGYILWSYSQDPISHGYAAGWGLLGILVYYALGYPIIGLIIGGLSVLGICSTIKVKKIGLEDKGRKGVLCSKIGVIIFLMIFLSPFILWFFSGSKYLINGHFQIYCSICWFILGLGTTFIMFGFNLILQDKIGNDRRLSTSMWLSWIPTFLPIAITCSVRFLTLFLHSPFPPLWAAGVYFIGFWGGLNLLISGIALIICSLIIHSLNGG